MSQTIRVRETTGHPWETIGPFASHDAAKGVRDAERDCGRDAKIKRRADGTFQVKSRSRRHRGSHRQPFRVGGYPNV